MNRKQKTWALLIPAAGFVGGTLLWRWISTRQEQPCPPWLSVLLENPYMHAVASAESILDRLALEPGMQVLDVGCGPGRLTIPAAQRVGPTGRVVALDIQPEMLRRAQERAAVNHCDNIQFVHAGVGTGAIPGDAFDRALLVTVLGEIPQQEAALAEIYAALKPCGVLSITEVLPDPHYQTGRAVRRLALRAGFAEGQRWQNGLAYTSHFLKPTQPKVSVQQLDPVTETLLLPLYFRARESERPDALIKDDRAVALVEQMAYDFTPLSRQAEQQASVMLRTRQFDQIVGTFLAVHPDGAVVDLGCGLDTRFDRLDNGRVFWYNLDLSEVMALRQQLLEEQASPRYHLIGQSLLDFSWMKQVQQAEKRPLLFIAEGVFPYFTQADIRQLVAALQAHFPGAELAFDGVPSLLEHASGLHPTLRTTQARVRWGLRHSQEILAWNTHRQLLQEYFYFDQPEPRLGKYRWLRFIRPFSRGFRIVHYRLSSVAPGA